MHEGSDKTESTYEYAGKTYRLVEHESEKWRVYDGDRYLGQVIPSPGGQQSGSEYTVDVAGEATQSGEPVMGGWQLVLEYLIDNSAPPVGA
jgi:hypothetical protein